MAFALATRCARSLRSVRLIYPLSAPGPRPLSKNASIPRLHPRRYLSTTAPSKPSFTTTQLVEDIVSGAESDELDLPELLYVPILPPDPPIWGVEKMARLEVPRHIQRPPYAATMRKSHTGKGIMDNIEDSERVILAGRQREAKIELGGADEVRIRQSCILAKSVLDHVAPLIKPGVTTNMIDGAVHEFIIQHRAYPSPLHYHGFPRSCCTSVNNVCVHGIPDDRPLQDGDIVTVDITVYLREFHGDTARTFLVGHVDERGAELCKVTTEALRRGIAACGPGKPFSAIGGAIHEYLIDKPFFVCPTFSGHGIGRAFHQPPWIVHEKNEEPGEMQPGHCFTVEPCIIEGPKTPVWIFPDGWTVSTENCARAAQAEHTVLITESGVDVLTA